MPDQKPPNMRAAFAQAIANLSLGHPMRHELYLSKLQPIAWANGTLSLQAPDQRVRDICALRLNRLLTAELRYVAGRDDIHLHYTVAQDGASC
jgi:hypothetical protein